MAIKLFTLVIKCLQDVKTDKRKQLETLLWVHFKNIKCIKCSCDNVFVCTVYKEDSAELSLDKGNFCCCKHLLVLL